MLLKHLCGVQSCDAMDTVGISGGCLTCWMRRAVPVTADSANSANG